MKPKTLDVWVGPIQVLQDLLIQQSDPTRRGKHGEGEGAKTCRTALPDPVHTSGFRIVSLPWSSTVGISAAWDLGLRREVAPPPSSDPTRPAWSWYGLDMVAVMLIWPHAGDEPIIVVLGKSENLRRSLMHFIGAADSNTPVPVRYP